MKQRTLHIILALALSATLGAIWLLPPEEESVDLSPRVQTTITTASGTATQKLFNVMRSVVNRRPKTDEVEVLAILPRERDSDDAGSNGMRLFSSNQWGQVAQEAAAPAIAEPTPEVAPPPPEAPPLPFRFIGRYNDGQKSLFFLEFQDQSLSVKIGDTIADNYRLERVRGSILTFRYLPLNQLQDMEIGGAQ